MCTVDPPDKIQIEISHFLKLIDNEMFKKYNNLPNQFLFRLLSGIICEKLAVLWRNVHEMRTN